MKNSSSSCVHRQPLRKAFASPCSSSFHWPHGSDRSLEGDRPPSRQRPQIRTQELDGRQTKRQMKRERWNIQGESSPVGRAKQGQRKREKAELGVVHKSP